MKLWKRNAVVAAIVLFVCVAVYLNLVLRPGAVGQRHGLCRRQRYVGAEFGRSGAGELGRRPGLRGG